ncbi:VOC family protein [Ruegeria pomeroyi]|nr:VOC family protein [Ruegeria pomeroyi]
MRLAHVSLIARDAPALAEFYCTALGCSPRRSATRLSGAWVGRGIGLPGAEILSIWLNLPDSGAPFLEIQQFALNPGHPPPQPDTPGLRHLAFATADIEATARAILASGGSQQGEITDLGSAEHPCRALYMRDPEGNLIELEQA